MEKKNVLNLIKYHIEENEKAFRNEAIIIAKDFDRIGDDVLAEYIMSLLSEKDTLSAPIIEVEFKYLRRIDTSKRKSLFLPTCVASDLIGIVNAISNKAGMNKFLFEGAPGSGKTEAVKFLASITHRKLFVVDFENVIDSKLGQTNKNICEVFREISNLPQPNRSIVLFDEFDAIALDRINSNDIRKMGRVTSTVLKEIDKFSDLNSELIFVATTNLFSHFDKALTRRFDAILNFDKYSREDLAEIAEHFFEEYIKTFVSQAKDTRLFKKILNLPTQLPYPGELKSLVKKSLAFSSSDSKYDYIKRLYTDLVSDLNNVSTTELYEQGFTLREIEK